MALVNQPPILASSFAVNGDKNTIPTTNSGTEGLASLSLGFPPITQQPVSQGGIPPQRADFNGIFNLITNFLMFIQNGSIFAYSSTLDYQPPAIVYGNNALYRCIATNGANTSAGVQPLSNTSYWQPLIPVGGITVSGNTITVTNETGTQIQYTIDTITNPPSQSDSSNKIVTSAWVKAYAPSKTGTGASGTWNITANKAIEDKNGLEIDTGYLKLSGGTINGNLYFNTTTERRISGNNNTGFYISPNGNIGLYDWDSDLAILQYTKNNNSVTVPAPPASDNSNRIATTAFVNNYAPSKTGSGATGTWNININGNAQNDGQGQIINTTYIKGVTANNATLTITKGNGTTSTTIINNVANATKATQDGNGDTINTTYLKLSGGTMTGDLKLNNTSERKIVGSNNDVGFYISPNGNIGLYDWDSDLAILQYTKNNNSVTSITPATSDNSTKIATTAFVKSLFTASKTTNGWHKEASTGIIWQWGTVTNTNINSNFNITFPITFNTALNAYISSTYGQGLGADSISGAEIISLTKEGMEIRSEWDDNVSRTYRYFAIGY